MKKLFSAFLILLLIISSSAISFAEVPGASTKIAFEDIEAIMLSNSIQMAVAKNAVDKAKLDYSNSKSDITETQAQYDALDPQSPSYWTSSLSLSNQLKALRSTGDSLKFALDSAEIRYNQQVKTFVIAAQKQYIGILLAEGTSLINENTIASLEKQLAAMNIRFLKGYASQKQLTTLSNQISDLKLSSNSQVEQTKALNSKLRSSLGLTTTAPLLLTPLLEFDYSAIEKIVYADDLAKVLENSITIKISQNSLDSINKTAKNSYNPSKFRYSIKDAELALSQTKTTAQESFQDQYNSLISSRNDLSISNRDLETKQKDLAIAKKKLALGLASSKSVADLANELTSLTIKNKAAKDNLYLDYIQYENSKLGY